MSELRLIAIAVIAGAALGITVGYYEVGTVEASFAPPPTSENNDPGSAIFGASQAYPLVVVDEVFHNFGTMQRGKTKSHEFVFKNEGDAPLQITVASTTCKCTVGEVGDQMIKPGGSAPVKLEWVAKTGVGDFSQTATIKTNDPRNSRIELEVSGVVTDTTGLDPQEFMLGKVTGDKPHTLEVYLAAYGETPIEATAAMAEKSRYPELFEVEVEPVEDLSVVPLKAATSCVLLRVTTKPGLPLGRMVEWVEVKTNLPDAEILRVPILGVVEGEVSIHGRGWAKDLGVLILGKIPREEGKKSKLLISFKGEAAENPQAEIGEVFPEWLQVSLGEPRKVREGVTHVPLTVEVPSGRLPAIYDGKPVEEGGQGFGDGRLQLKTKTVNQPEIDIRVRFIIE